MVKEIEVFGKKVDIETIKNPRLKRTLEKRFCRMFRYCPDSDTPIDDKYKGCYHGEWVDWKEYKEKYGDKSHKDHTEYKEYKDYKDYDDKYHTDEWV
ncbi:hypothetical protein FJZ53_00405 [Candidatus Woesearchaeota archaeon]|nr:hypothetical protein [Candidatus Woesearchaeota archaeon]